jgi:hypothetical protein
MTTRKNTVKATIVHTPAPTTATVIRIADDKVEVTDLAIARLTAASNTDAKSRTQWVDAAMELFAGNVRPDHLEFGTNKKHGPKFDEEVYKRVHAACVAGVSGFKGKIRCDTVDLANLGKRTTKAWALADMLAVSDADMKRLKPDSNWTTFRDRGVMIINAQMGRIRSYLTTEWARIEPDNYKAVRKGKAATTPADGAQDKSQLHMVKRILGMFDANIVAYKGPDDKTMVVTDASEFKTGLVVLLAIIGKYTT